MSQKRHSPEQIINKLRQAEVELARGVTVAQACKKIGVTDQTYSRWRAEYGGMRLDQAKWHQRNSPPPVWPRLLSRNPPMTGEICD